MVIAASPSRSSAPGEFVSPSRSPVRSPTSSASSVAYSDLFVPDPVARRALPLPPPPPPPPAPSARPVARDPSPNSVCLYWVPDVNYNDLWEDILRAHPHTQPECLLSLDYHGVLDKDFWSSAQVLDRLATRPSIGLLVLSYTTSQRLAQDARAFIARLLNSSQHRGPIVLLVCPRKVGVQGKHYCLTRILDSSPRSVKGAVHIDDSYNIVEEVQARASPGISARHYEKDSPWSLLSFLDWHRLL